MFNLGKFDSSAGGTLDWKIECDDLSNDDWSCIAHIISRNYTFCIVHGISTGGDTIARALQEYCTISAETVLIVDDVLTTGESMRSMQKFLIEQHGVPVYNIQGVALFSRARIHKVPLWVDPIFQLESSINPA